MAQQFTQAGANIQKNVPRLFGPSEVPEKGTFSGDFTADLSKRLAALGHIGGDIASTALSIPIIAANIYIPETIKQNYRKTVDYVAGKITENPETLNTLNAVNEWIDTKASPAWKALDPDTKENIAKDLPSLLALLGSGKPSALNQELKLSEAKQALTQIPKDMYVGGKLVQQKVRQRVKSLFTKPAASIEEVFDEADSALQVTAKTKIAAEADEAIKTTPAGARITAEAEAPKTTLKEKFIDLTPAQKKRLQQAGPQKTQEYIDVINARNLDDTLPTAYEYGGDKVRGAVENMEKILNDVGSDIGKTRNKLSTIQTPQVQIDNIEALFNKELEGLNLAIRNGTIAQKTGTVSRVASQGDIKALSRLYNDFLAFKQSPDLTTLIDLRSSFDNVINFGKRANEVSNSVDPLSRAMRKKLADSAATIVGKEKAIDVARYSDVIDAINELRSYTDRRAGGEYLLRLVLSGRGGEARGIIRTVKDITGIDLMDDAVLMTLTTDMLGTQAQKTLFAQQITQSGLDVAKAIKGDPSAVIRLLKEYGIDVEKTLIEAAQSSP